MSTTYILEPKSEGKRLTSSAYRNIILKDKLPEYHTLVSDAIAAYAIPGYDDTAEDISGHGRDAFWYGTPSYADGKKGRCFNFTGSNYLRAGNLVGSGYKDDRSFFVRLKVNYTGATYRPIFGFIGNSVPVPYDKGDRLYLYNSTAQHWTYFAGAQVAGYTTNIAPTLSNDEWCSLGFSVSASGTTKYYVNGIYNGITQTRITDVSDYISAAIGAVGSLNSPTASLYLTGQLSEIMFFPRELTQYEFESLNAGPLPASVDHAIYYQEFSGAGTQPVSWLPPATVLAGSSLADDSRIPVSALGSQYAIAAWVKIDNDQVNTVSDNIIFTTSGASVFFQWGSTTANLRGVAGARLANASIPAGPGPKTTPTGEWHLYGAVVGGGETKTVVDGVEIGTQAAIPAYQLTTTVLFGSGAAGASGVKGEMQGLIIIPNGTVDSLLQYYLGDAPPLYQYGVNISDKGVVSTGTWESQTGDEIRYRAEIYRDFELIDTIENYVERDIRQYGYGIYYAVIKSYNSGKSRLSNGVITDLLIYAKDQPSARVSYLETGLPLTEDISKVFHSTGNEEISKVVQISEIAFLVCESQIVDEKVRNFLYLTDRFKRTS